VSGDTIAAIATAAGVGGVGIVRLSGPQAIAIAADALGVAPDALDRRVQVRWARDGAGRKLDQVLAFAMRAPASFTGEDVAELHGHGGGHNLERLLAAVIERGARVAEPGEFTRRAVAAGKLDLLRAEALLEVIHAGSERAWRLAQANLEGRLGEQVVAIERRALAVLAEIEGAIDFPEDDLELGPTAVIDVELGALRDACAALADGFRHGRALSQGVSVALVGPVNVGKSSLLNALVGRERALVGAAPGTTRDWLEVDDVWSGVAVTLIDTAGLRATDDPVEQRGIELGEARVASADVVVVVNDGAAPCDDGARFGERAVVVRSKADVGGGGPGLATSAASPIRRAASARSSRPRGSTRWQPRRGTRSTLRGQCAASSDHRRSPRSSCARPCGSWRSSAGSRSATACSTRCSRGSASESDAGACGTPAPRFLVARRWL